MRSYSQITLQKRVFENALDQSGANGIRDDVARERSNILFFSNGMIMVSAGPDSAQPTARTGGLRFEPAHALRERPFSLKLYQPMKMVGHEHPAKQLGVLCIRDGLERAADGTGKIEIPEPTFAAERYKRDQVNPAGFRIPAFPQCAMAGVCRLHPLMLKLPATIAVSAKCFKACRRWFT